MLALQTSTQHGGSPGGVSLRALTKSGTVPVRAPDGQFVTMSSRVFGPRLDITFARSVGAYTLDARSNNLARSMW